VRCWDAGPFNAAIAPGASGLLALDLHPARADE
jgi:hypothetical protein